MGKLNRVLCAAFASAVPLVVLGSEPAAAWGWYGCQSVTVNADLL